MSKTNLFRVNTRISTTLNDWLDEESKTTGLSKSTLVMLAIENYHQQKEVMKNMSNMGELMEKLNKIEDKLPVE